MPKSSKPRKADSSKFVRSAVSIMEGSGTLGEKRQPFTYQMAVDLFQGWVYAASMLNACCFASVPLRLYSANTGGKRLYATRKPGRKSFQYLTGNTDVKPSQYVLKNAVRFKDNMEEVIEDHPVLDILGKVNEYYNGFDLQVLRAIYLQLTGNAYLYVIRDEYTGLPVELWPMPSQWVDVIPGKTEDESFIKGYAFGQSRTNKQVFTTEEVLHFRWPNPGNMYYGKGKVEAGWNIIAQDTAIHTMDTAIYQNHARPDYAVIVKSGYNDAAFKRFEKEISNKFQGTDRAGKFAMFSGDVDIKPLAWPPKDLGGRDQILEEIASVFGVPITKLKANDPNRSNAEVGDTSWLRDTIIPMLRMDEQRLNETLIPMFGLEGQVFLAYDNPMPDNEVYERDRTVAYLNTGLVTRNEMRTQEGMEPIEGGDTLLVPAGLIPIDKVGQPVLQPSQEQKPDSGAKPKESQEVTIDNILNGTQIASATQIVVEVAKGNIPRESGIAMLQAFFNFTTEQAQKIMGPAGIEIPEIRAQLNATAQDQPTAQTVAAEVVKMLRDDAKPISQKEYRYHGCKCKEAAIDNERDAESESLIGDITGKVAYLFKIYRGTVVDALMSVKSAESDAKAAANKAKLDKLTEKFSEQVAESIKGDITRAIGDGGIAGVGKLHAAGIDVSMFDVTNPKIDEFITDYTVRLARSISETATESVKRIVQDGIREGKDINTIAREIPQAPGWTDDGIANRAEMIARTESARAHIEGQIEAWEDSGVVESKEWLVAPGACEFCVEAAAIFNEQKPGLREAPKGLRLGDTLQAGESAMVLDYAAIDGPPLHPFDRCDMVPVLKEVS